MPDNFEGILSNGTSGDINNINFRRVDPRSEPLERLKLVASQVASVAEHALQAADHHEHLTVDVRHRTLTLGVRRPGPVELERAKQRHEAADPDTLTRDDVYALEAIELSTWPATVEVPVQVMRVGQLGIVALPCEAFAEIGLEIKRHSPLETTFVVGLANDYHGYLPTPGQHALGGYETWPSRWSYLETGASAKISLAAIELLREVAPADTPTAALPWRRALYLVVPKNEKTFSESLRKELNVLGPHKTHWPQYNRFRFKHGYLAWLTIREATKVSEHPEIKEVTAFLADDVRVGARPRGIERNYFEVFLCPNSWETDIDAATYRSAESLAAEWQRRFAHDPSVLVKLDEQSGTIRVTITGVKPDPQISAVIRRSGQVDKIQWSQDPPMP